MSAAAPGLRVVVVGGGVIGLACADELVRAGHDVRVCDPTPAGGSTYAAAGMLAPGGEAWFGEEALLRLGIDSLGRWPEFGARLEARSGRRLDLRSTGTVLVAADRDDLTEVQRACRLLDASGVRVEQLDRRALRVVEPSLSGRTVGGALLPDDRHVNPRRVADALLAVLGDRVLRSSATPAADGVVLDDGVHLPADVVLLATGATGMPHVRPVRGEAVRVRVRSGQAPTRVLRARVHGERVYVVPRADGELVIGATEEEHPAGDGPPLPSLGGVARLLETARALVPGLVSAELVEVVARDRPGSPDNGPLLGPVPGPGPTRLLLAGGHYRGGVLLAPVTAATVRAHVDGLDIPEAAGGFAADRFATPPFERDEDRCTST